MAAETLATIFNALSQFFAPDIERQWNRTTYLLNRINARPGAVTAGNGKNFAFGVEFTGSTASTVAEGSDIATTEYNSDINEPALLPYATYRSSFQVSEQEVDIARRSAGTPTALMDLFGERILDSQAILARTIEQDCLTGTGVDTNGNPTIIGIFGGALAATGNYGGLNPATYSEWAGNVVSNGGTLRALTPDLMLQVDQQIFNASSLPWDLIVTDAAILRKYMNFFVTGQATNAQTPIARMNDAAANPSYGLGNALNVSSQFDNLYWMGKTVMRNPVSPANKMAFLNTSKLEIQYMPHTPPPNEIELLRTLGLEGSTGGNAIRQATGIPARVAEIAKTGDSHKVSMRATVALGVKRRNAMGLLTDIAES